MSQPASASCLYTRVRNLSANSQYFGFLGAHGKTLAANEEYLHKGNLPEQLSALRKRRHFDSLVAALENGVLELLHTPAVILQDIASNRPRAVAMYADALGVVDPCWDTAGSSDFST